MIDLQNHLTNAVTPPKINARFQRNSDGQFVGRMTLNGEVMECWLVFDGGVENPAFLKLSFEEPKSFG